MFTVLVLALAAQQWRCDTIAERVPPMAVMPCRFDGTTTHRSCFTAENARPGARAKVVWNSPVAARLDDAGAAFDSATEYTAAFTPHRSTAAPRSAGTYDWTPNKNVLAGRSEYADEIGHEHAGMLGVLAGRTNTLTTHTGCLDKERPGPSTDARSAPAVDCRPAQSGPPSGVTSPIKTSAGEGGCGKDTLRGESSYKQRGGLQQLGAGQSDLACGAAAGHLRCPNQWTAMVPNPHLNPV